MTVLTRKVMEYQRTGEGLGRLVDQISQLVYTFPRSQNGFCAEDGAEFLLEFLPRITRLIERYRETGQSFESYLASTLRWQIKSLAASRAGEQIRLTALHGPGCEIGGVESVGALQSGMEVHEPAKSGMNGAGLLPGSQGRRLVHLSLKMAERLDEPDYLRVAAVSGCDPEWLVNCWQALRDGCAAQRERRRIVQERRDRAWFQVRCLQYRLRLVLEHEEREAATRRLAMWHRRYQHALRVLARMHCGPSHAEIARVLGVPKGTVDSSVFYGKRELQDPDYRRFLATAMANP